MNRREFHGLALGALGRPAFQLPETIDRARVLRHLEALSEIGKEPEGGVSRVAYTEFDREGRERVLSWMREAGLETRIDVAGNLVGRRAGGDEGLPPLMMGSHIDTVPSGGNYDGIVGSLGAIEVAQSLRERRVVTRHPIEVVIFQNEQGGKTGSRSLAGEVTSDELALVSQSGKTFEEGMRFLGGAPERLGEARRRPGEVAAYLELHVEQGGLLDRDAIEIGVVEGIVGIKRYNVSFEGFANHAGATPMSERQDALLAAARFVDAVNRVASRRPGRQVATVGRIQAFPGAPNVIPGRTTLSLEIRDLDMEVIDSLYDEIKTEGEAIARSTRTSLRVEEYYMSRAAPTEERLRGLVETSARELGFSTLRMPSGAGHDAQSIALVAPVGMIFIPSVGGISHSPREFSRPGDIARGVNVLFRTLLKLDAAN